MVRLKELEVFGFKSFADKTVFKFPERNGITTVVGPNGSGKSNVIDAIRWVFGEQSPRAMRIQDMDDVIFKSGGGKDLSLAWVRVTLTATEDDLPAEIVFERKIYAGATENEYSINHQPVRLKDVQLMLAKLRIGLKGMAIVNQGVTDNFLKAGPKERKDILIDTVGLKELVLKKQDAIRGWLKTKQNLAHIGIRLQEIAPQMRIFEREKEKLSKKEALLKEVGELDALFASGRMFTLTQSRDALSEDVERLTAERNRLQEAMEGAEREFQGTSPKRFLEKAAGMLRSALAANREEELRDKIREVINAIDETVRQWGAPKRGGDATFADTIRLFKKTEEELITKSTELKRIDGELETLRRTFGAVEPVEYKNLDQIETKLRRLRTEAETLETADTEIIKEFEGISARGADLEKQHADLEKGLEDTKTLIKKLDREIKHEFIANLKRINEALAYYFPFVFNGGSAKLVARPKTHEVFLRVELPAKKVKSIDVLSGGEKSLTALSLMLSIAKSVEPPFLILDEADAALDEANAVRFASLLKEVSKHIQVIVISHNRATIEASDYLYGITAGSNNVSQVVSLILPKN